MRFLIIAIALLFQYWEESNVVQALRTHIQELTLAQNEGRAPGSAGEKAAAEYVWTKLSEAGVDMLCTKEGDTFGVSRPGGDTLVSRNAYGFIQGYDPVLKDKYIVVGAHIDNIGMNTLTVDGEKVNQIYSGANSNASGVAMMLELASRVASSSVLFKRSVIFAGFGSGTSLSAGAWYFLNRSFAKDRSKIDAMVNLDALGIENNGIQAFTSGNQDLNSMINVLSASVQPVRPTILSREPYPSDHQVFYAAEIPSVCFTTGRFPQHNTPADTPSIIDYDYMERELEYLYNFILSLANAPEGQPAFHDVSSSKKADDGSGIVSWSDCDVPPTFLGNVNPSFFLEKWVYQYLKYPQDCIREGVQGRVMVEFVIEKDGKVSSVRVLRSPDERLSEAAQKVVAASPKWKAARMKGQKVRSSMTIPVEFRLKKK